MVDFGNKLKPLDLPRIAIGRPVLECLNASGVDETRKKTRRLVTLSLAMFFAESFEIALQIFL